MTVRCGDVRLAQCHSLVLRTAVLLHGMLRQVSCLPTRTFTVSALQQVLSVCVTSPAASAKQAVVAQHKVLANHPDESALPSTSYTQFPAIRNSSRGRCSSQRLLCLNVQGQQPSQAHANYVQLPEVALLCVVRRRASHLQFVHISRLRAVRSCPRRMMPKRTLHAKSGSVVCLSSP